MTDYAIGPNYWREVSVDDPLRPGELFLSTDDIEAAVIDYVQGIARNPTVAELKGRAATVKREEIYREQEIRSATVWGKDVDRYMFAWIEEFYTAILKPAARNNITEAGAPITFGLKQLRDNRNALLAGLETWVNDPLKTAEDIMAFDVVGWSGWSVARP